METTKKPKIRFKGFTNAWEQVILGNLLEEYHEVTTKNNQYPVLTSSRKGIFLQKEYFAGNQIASANNTGYNIVPYGYFTYRHMSDDEFFHFNINDIVKKGIVSTLYPVFTTKKGLDSKYLQYQLNEGIEFRKYAIIQKQGGSRTYMYLNKLKKLKVTMPKSEQEQERISQGLSKVDKLITLHQRKCEKLQNIKKSLLEKMFPKNNEKFPAIRFKGFTNAWEQENLLNLFNKIIDFRGRTPKKLGLDWSDSGYLALSALNVKDGYIDKNIEAHYGNKELYDKWMNGNELHKGQVLFTTEAPMGNVAQIPDNKKYILSQRTIAFEVKTEVITENFLAILLKSDNVTTNLTAISSGGTAKGVSQRTLSSINLSICNDLEEQSYIGKYFKAIDKLLTLHQRQVEKLQNIKKALLEKMFV